MSVVHSIKSNLINISNQTNLALITLSLSSILAICAKRHEDNDTYNFLLQSPFQDKVVAVVAYCSVPLVASLLSYIYFLLQRQFKLSTLYDMHGNPIHCGRRLPPFLPVKEEQSTWYQIYDELKLSPKRYKKEIQVSKRGWAMVTGATRGIGRAIAVELARYKIPVILVGRNKIQLDELAMMLEECYAIATKVFIADFSHNNAATELFEEISKIPLGLEIDILIHNAGIGDTRDFVEMDTTKIQDIITVNTITGSKLCQMFGVKMKERRRGRIVLISSITGAVPGVPTAAIYAATKAFQRSFAISIGMELEPYGVGVTCIMPGAVHDTNFSSQSSMNDALIWKVPFGRLTAPVVASSAVKGMIAGCPEIVVGWMNVAAVKYLLLLLPDRISTFICKMGWSPPPSLLRTR